MKIAATVHMAERSLSDDLTASDPNIVCAAQAADVTNLNYLYARLLLKITGGNIDKVRRWLETDAGESDESFTICMALPSGG